MAFLSEKSDGSKKKSSLISTDVGITDSPFSIVRIVTVYDVRGFTDPLSASSSMMFSISGA
ncbi:hypothetical protein QUF72_10710 [Desulfobacterales bacterium HSG2]|nr:hypothetical protein [Desulfobacterales bacterium HSG2]